MNKRGISAIVATVLIILITVAAVTIIWATVIPMVRDNLDFSSLEGRVSVVTSGGYTYYDSDNESASVQVKRDPDEGVMNRIRITFSFEGDSISSSVAAPESGQTKVYVFDLTGYGEPDSVSVSPIFVSSSGKEKVGDVTSDAEISEGSLGDMDYIPYSPEEDYIFDIEEGLVGYWRFEGNAEDSSGNENHGEIIGSLDCDVEGRNGIGKACDFTGNSGGHISLGNNSDLKPIGDFTLSFWVELSVSGYDGGTNWHIYAWEDYEDWGWTTRVGGSHGRILFRTSQLGSSTSGNGYSDSNLALSNTFYHVTLVYSNETSTWYIDSEKDTSYEPMPAPVANTDAMVYIGALPNQRMNGKLDEVMLYDRALSAEEVKNLYDIQKD